MKSVDSPYLSIVIPLYNEEEVIPELIKQLLSVCQSLNRPFEIILVDDGSTDRTHDLLVDATRKDPRIKAIRFSRNFGHQAAFNAGIDVASGDLVLTMDGDLQHPPHLIPNFVRSAEEGNDIVIGERINNKQNSKLRNSANSRVYKLLSAITNLEFRNASDFALYKRRVVDVLKQLPEKERFLRGIVQWVGFKKKYISYIVEARKHGKAKYNFKRLLSLIMSGVTSFSAFPLRIAFWLGLIIMAISFIFGVFVVYDHYAHPNPLIAGWATVVILVLFLGSAQLTILGVVGEDLYKMFNEVKGRPLYIISEAYNLDDENIKPSVYGIHVTK